MSQQGKNSDVQEAFSLRTRTLPDSRPRESLAPGEAPSWARQQAPEASRLGRQARTCLLPALWHWADSSVIAVPQFPHL